MFNSRTFATGHIVFMYSDIESGEQRVIFGVSRRSELSTIGGHSECGETLMSTLVREYTEEVHESIITISELVRLLEKAKVDINGSCVTLLVDLGKFDFETARRRFRAHANFLTRRIIPKSRREIADIVSIRLQDIIDRVSGITNSLAIRSAAISALKTLL